MKTISMFGTLNDLEMEQLIHQQIIGRIGCHADGTTYVVPVSYVYDGEYIYGRTHEGMKVNMMRKNPTVCFQVDDMRNLANWRSVIAWGEFEELNSESQRKNALQLLMKRALPLITSETMRISPQWPFPSQNVDEISGVVYRIRLEKKTGRFEKSINENFFAT